MRRRNLRRVRIRRLIVVIGLILVIPALLFGRGYLRLKQLSAQQEAIQQEINQVQAQNEQLRQEIKRVQSEAYIQQVAREELGLILPGEILFTVAKTTQADGAEYFDVKRRPDAVANQEVPY